MSASSDVVLIDDGDDDVVELESAARKDDAKRPLERAETPARKRQKVWNGVGQDEDELRALFPEVVGDPRPTKHDSQELLDARLSKFNLVDRLARVMGGIPEPLQPSNAHRSSWTVLQLRRRLRYGLLVQAVLNFRHASSVDLEATEDLASELRSGVRPLPETLLQRNRLGSGVALQLRRIGFLVSELTSYGKLCGVELFEAAEEEQDELEESKPSGSGTGSGSGSGSMSMSMTRARKPAENVLEDLACKTRHWAKGTGYGGTPSRSTYGGKGKGRKRKSQGQSRAQPAANAKREDKDDAIAAFLFEKALDVLGIVTSWAATLPHLNPVSADTVLDNGDIPLGCGAIRCLLRRSGVLMLLARYLREANVKEVSGAREATFQLAFALLLQLTATPCLAGLLFERLEDGAKDSDGLEEEDDIIEGATLASLCPTLLSMIEVYDKLQAGMTSSANSAMGIMNAMSGLFELAGSVCQHTLGQGGVDRETNAWDLVRDACQRVKDIERTLGQGTVAKLRNAHAVYRRLQSKGPEREDGGDEPEVVALKNDPDLKRYLSEMRALRFKSIENLKSMHSFAATYDADTGRRGNDPSMVRRMRRISTELANLAGGGLPVESGSAIFLRSDDEHLGLLKALIIGPEDTPYENGLFEFDIYLPMNYPNEPPKVQFLTTGGGRVRFNPNLYNNGKVCLSLIGTWSGPGWDKQKSSLLQVLISIQSLILVNHPYYNEPGFERVMGTKGGEQQSISYSFGIRGDTMQTAILDQLRQPPPAFVDVVEVYRRRKRRAVLEQCRVWRMEAFALDASLAKLPKQKHQVRRGMHTKAKDFGPGMDRVCHTLELFLEESSSAAAGGGFKSPFATSASMPEDSVDRKSRRRKLLEAMNAFVGSSEVEVVATENQGEVITLEE